MLTLSSKTNVITLIPNLENERISIRSGRLAIALSTGDVMNCSTSCAAKVGALVITCTWLLVTSGNASIGSFDALHTPQIMSANVIMPMASLFFILNCIILSNIYITFL